MRKNASLIAGPMLFVVMFFVELDPANPQVSLMAGIALWMAVWWMTDAIPLAATALLPVLLFPLTGLMSGSAVAPIYFNHIILLFLGGFVVALAMERWHLHRRIALRTLMLFGTRPSAILLGFMATTAFLSMWISNTATTMMMVPIVFAIVQRLEEGGSTESVRGFARATLIGIAYSASIGGAATLVGTPPNLSFARILAIQFPEAPEISFADWFAFGFPVSVVFLASAWLVLTLIHSRTAGSISIEDGAIRDQYRKLGPMSTEEKVVLADFTLLALLWLFRKDISIGALSIPGWASLVPNGSMINDGVTAIGMALILFVVPSRRSESGRVMDWQAASKLPWHIVLLFGGGFALAQGFMDSGLSEWLGHRLSGLQGIHPLLIVAAVCLMITFLTELTSNTATAEMFLPILGALAIAIGVNPLLLMIPGTLACSFAFMLPVATPPNAIVFGTERLKVSDMARSGVVLNLIGVILVTTAIYVLGSTVLGIDLAAMPDWAK
jgi:sodium-dependent dicarboxylate transporter 2/3/5